MILFADKNQDG